VNIEEILSRLERIDHKEYRCGFEFADSSTFDEMGRCFEERKILAKEIERLNNIINEFEEWLNAKYEEMHDIWYVKILNKLNELKRNSSNE
jgi:cob(I)alamin adenosyltransferase